MLVISLALYAAFGTAALIVAILADFANSNSTVECCLTATTHYAPISLAVLVAGFIAGLLFGVVWVSRGK